jgi:uncharacterized membrane protein
MKKTYAEITAKNAKKLDPEKTIVVETSEPGKIESFHDWKSLAITLGMVAISAVVTKLIEVLPGIVISDTTGQLIMGLVIMVLKTAQKYITERKYVV